MKYSLLAWLVVSCALAAQSNPGAGSAGGHVSNSPSEPPANDELTTLDEPATFKVGTNLVEVPVVVRDRQGRAVGNLRKDDFRLFDKGKRQEITKFSVQKTAAQAATIASRAQGSRASGDASSGGAPVSLPSRFMAFVFDDLHMQFADLPQVRNAFRRYVDSSLQPADRVALYTTSGRVAVDFTDKPAALDAALLRIRPASRAASSVPCLHISYAQAEMIERQVSLRPDPEDVMKCPALRAALYDTSQCTPAISTFETAVGEITDAFVRGREESREVLVALREIVRRLALMPGSRSIVLASPGFFVSPDLHGQGSDLLALAIRSKVLINTIDARGVWANPAFDASQRGGQGGGPPPEVIAFKSIEQSITGEELITLAEGTGGMVNLDNDFYGGIRKAAAAPEYIYVLGFTPQNLKFDGAFHALKVTLNTGSNLTLQVRRGYWAPNRAEDAVTVSKQEIENAVYSRDEIHELPVEMYTQVKRAGDEVKLNVLTSVDLKLMRLRKADERNRNDLTIVAAVFDSNGNFVAGKQMLLQIRLRDETVRGLEQRPPFTLAANFDLKPGTYLVRLVARDAESQQLTVENAAVQIPAIVGGE